MLVRRTASPRGKSLAKTPRIIKGHVIREDIRKTVIKIHGAHGAKLAQKKNTTPYKTRQIREQPNTTIKTAQKKSHPAIHTQTMLKGNIHKATWKTLHTAPYLASIATIAAKAMHECAPHTPYEIMSKGSGTPEATMITRQLEQIHKNDSQEEKRQYLQMMWPLREGPASRCSFFGVLN